MTRPWWLFLYRWHGWLADRELIDGYTGRRIMDEVHVARLVVRWVLDWFEWREIKQKSRGE